MLDAVGVGSVILIVRRKIDILDMKNEATTESNHKTPSEAAGYIGGVFTAIAQAVMPVRMWLILTASVVLLIKVFDTESLLTIARSVSIYIVVVAVLIASAIFQRR